MVDVEVVVVVEGERTIISSWPEFVITFAWNEDGGVSGKNMYKGKARLLCTVYTTFGCKG